MVEANIASVFVGIESPNEASLRETKKFQNVRAGGTLVEKVHRIQEAGMEVWCGMILGFDHDDETIFDAQIRVHRRGPDRQRDAGDALGDPQDPALRPAGRRGAARPRRTSRSSAPTSSRCGSTASELRDGYVRVLSALNDTQAYFDRLDDLYLDARLNFSRGANRYWRRHPWRLLRAKGLLLAQALGLLARLTWHVPDPALRREYLRRVWRLVKVRRDPSVLWIYVFKCAMHYHAHTMAQRMNVGLAPVVNSY